MHPRALSSPLPALPVPSPSHCAAFASSTATRLSQAIGLPPVVAQCPCRKHTPMCQRSRDRIPLSHPPRVPRRPVKGGTMPFARDTSGSDRCHQVPTSAGAPGSVSTPPAPHLGISRRSVTRRPPLPRFTATPPPGAHLKIVSEHSSTVLLWARPALKSRSRHPPAAAGCRSPHPGRYGRGAGHDRQATRVTPGFIRRVPAMVLQCQAHDGCCVVLQGQDPRPTRTLYPPPPRV